MDVTNWTVLFACGTALAGVGTGLYLTFWVMRLPSGSDRMQQIAQALEQAGVVKASRKDGKPAAP